MLRHEGYKGGTELNSVYFAVPGTIEAKAVVSLYTSSFLRLLLCARPSSWCVLTHVGKCVSQRVTCEVLEDVKVAQAYRDTEATPPASARPRPGERV